MEDNSSTVEALLADHPVGETASAWKDPYTS